MSKPEVTFDRIADWDPGVLQVRVPNPPRVRRIANRLWPPLDVVRVSASRPWRLEASTPKLRERLRYPGPVRVILVESVVEREYSERCLRYALESGEFDEVAVIDPQRGQGFAHDYAIRRLITAPYVLKWDDDFEPLVDVPVDDCVRLMEAHPAVNQVAYNKRRTVPRKPFWSDEWDEWEALRAAGVLPNNVLAPEETHGRPVTFVKKERLFAVPGVPVPGPSPAYCYMTVKDKWWFGPSLWRMAFVRRHWQFFAEHHHNRWNDLVLYKLIDPGSADGPWPTGVPAEAVERAIGCYLWGRIGDERMVEHTGHGDSHWKGEYAARMAAEGRQVVGGTDDRGRSR